jgi:transcriptional regulator with XRE-family HTH domain
MTGQQKRAKVLKIFGANLKRLRQDRNITTRQFADLAGIAYSQVWALESGRRDPSLTTLLALSEALNVSIDDLTKFD